MMIRYGLRHTHATDLLRAGVHPTIASERICHAPIAIMTDTRSHAIAGLQEATAQRIDTALRRALPDVGWQCAVSVMAAKR
jgi:hypothetical protein